MQDDSNDETMSVPDAEIIIIGQALDALGRLARLRLAIAENRPEVDVDDVAQPALRIVLDDAAGLLALGIQQRDGRVQQLAGYHLNAVRARLALLADATLREEDGGTPPASWH